MAWEPPRPFAFAVQEHRRCVAGGNVDSENPANTMSEHAQTVIADVLAELERGRGAFDDLGVLGARGRSQHRRPWAPTFVGVHFLRKRKSSLLDGVGKVAAIVARQIAAR
jgi:hypothetical protein